MDDEDVPIQNKVVSKRGNPAWSAGVSGNPGGRPKSALTARLACRAMNDETLGVLVELMRNSGDDKVRAQCAIRIRDEANGKPCSVVEMPHDDDDSNPLASLSDSDLLKAAIDAANALGVSN